jgi:hypothetical protein
VGIAVQLPSTCAQFMNTAFDTGSLTHSEWFVILAFGAAAMVLMDIIGIVLRRLRID